MAGAAVAGDSEKAYTANFTWYMFFSCTVAGMCSVLRDPPSQICEALCASVKMFYVCLCLLSVCFTMLQPAEELCLAGIM